MVEVFKTNVIDQEEAKQLINKIHQTFSGYGANFDLDDCDKILRVCCEKGDVRSSLIIDFLKASGFCAEILQENNEHSDAFAMMQ